MKIFVVFILFACMAAMAETPSSVQAETSGTCSPIVQGNQGKVQFTCNAAVDAATAKKIEAILSMILRNTKDKDTTNRKLDDVLEYVSHLQPGINQGSGSIAQIGGTGNTSQIGDNNSEINVGRLTPAEQRRYREAEDRITDLLKESKALIAQCLVPDPNPECETRTNEWASRTYAYLASIRPSYAATFDTAVGLSFSYTAANGKPVPQSNGRVIDFIKARNAVLTKILGELSAAVS